MCDLRGNPKVPAYGRYGGLFVRWGKSPKRRIVYTVRELDWIVPILDHYLTEVRPLLVSGDQAAI